MNLPNSKMSRSDVVQRLLDLFEEPDYLEIGVSKGKTFNAVSASTKTAVDPKFQFETAGLRSERVHFYEVPSDDFFGTIARGDRRYDVIYVDGLHTFEQTLRDLLNAQIFLKPRGIILIDDVRPSSHVAAIRDLNQHQIVRTQLGIESRAWMGDVFRLLYFIDTFMQQFTMRVINENHGQAIMWRQARASTSDDRFLDVALKSFTDLLLEKRFEGVNIASVLGEYGAVHGLSVCSSLASGDA